MYTINLLLLVPQNVLDFDLVSLNEAITKIFFLFPLQKLLSPPNCGF